MEFGQLSLIGGRRVAFGAAAIAYLASINPDGWTGQTIANPAPAPTPDTAPIAIPLARQGFSATGAATTINEAVIPTARVRQAAPNDAVPTAQRVALSDYVYATDTAGAVVNNSTEVSPKPIAQWSTAPRQTFTARLAGGVLAFHRNGIACVIVKATDGVTTVSQTIPAASIANRTGDRGAVIEYLYDIDISTLANGPITYDAEVYPRIGAAASVLKSNATAAETPRTFCTQKARKGPIRYVYVDSAAGNDATFTMTTTLGGANDADHKPAQTIKGAIEGARNLCGDYRLEGVEFRLRAGTWVNAEPAFNFYQDANSSEIVISRDPAVPRATVIITGDGSKWGATWVRFRDITLNRAAFVYMAGTFTFRDCDIDGGGNNIPLTDHEHYFEGGINFANPRGQTFIPGASGLAMIRGVTASPDVASCTIDPWHCVGSYIGGGFNSNSQSESGSIIHGSRTISGPTIAGSGQLNGAAIVQNVFEYTDVQATFGISISSDGQSGNTSHVIWWHNTELGANNAGRRNIFYDEAPGTTRRVHKLMSLIGNISVQINCKSDRFVNYFQANADAPNRTGAWPYMYGVGCRQEWSMFVDAGPNQAAFRQDYPGIGASIGTSSTVRNDPLFTGPFRATTFNGAAYTAGAGGGTYTLQAGSPAKNRVPSPPIPFDFAGQARGATSSSGAYH